MRKMPLKGGTVNTYAHYSQFCEYPGPTTLNTHFVS